MQEISIYMRQIINDFDSLGDDDKLICILARDASKSVLKPIYYDDVDCLIL